MNPSLSLLALAICSTQVSATTDNWLRVLPVGSFKSVDGRPTECAAWVLTAEHGQRMVAALKQRQDGLVIDYEHQTLKSATNGQPAPASGWMQDFEWRDDGLYARCSWTESASAMIASQEYRYISPVFSYDQKTGMVDGLLHAALTNTPALDGLTDVLAQAALSLFSTSPPSQTTEDSAMDELLERMQWMLNLPVGATAEDIKVQLDKIIAQLSNGQGMAAASVDLLAILTTNATQIVALSQQAQATAPDPTKFVPIEVMQGLQAQVAALSAQTQTNEHEALVVAALSDGRLLPAQEAWARGVAKSNPTFLKSFLDTAPKIAALTQQQSQSTKPDQHLPAAGLDATALAICSQMGIDPAAYQKTLATGA